MQTSKFRPALIGGAVMGVMSALPIIGNLGNACCCLWVVCGGVVAAYLLQQEQEAPITPGDGALVGLLAGIVGAFVAAILSIPVSLMMAPMQRELLRRLTSENPQFQMPPGFEDFASSATFGVIGTLFYGMIMLVAGAIFSTLGGLLGAAIFKKPGLPGTAPGPSL